jgi:hypothetical protein
VHQLPAHPSNARVKIWRRLQQIGALPVKNAVHILPDSAQAIEDFEWLRAEVVVLGGQASLFHVASIDPADERQLIRGFQAASQREFTRLGKEIKAVRANARHDSKDGGDRQVVRALQDRVEQASGRDFFPAPGGRDVETALSELIAERRQTKTRTQPSRPYREDAEAYRRRQWVTRPRPGVDRFASAWLIRRFIDRDATFVFAAAPDRFPEAVPFDMYQAGGFKHEGDSCTFEVLLERFAIRDGAAKRIGEIVHDIDLKEDRYRSPHAPTVARLVEGLRASIPDDAKLLDQGMAMFEALYMSFETPRRPRTGRGRIC